MECCAASDAGALTHPLSYGPTPPPNRFFPPWSPVASEAFPGQRAGWLVAYPPSQHRRCHSSYKPRPVPPSSSSCFHSIPSDSPLLLTLPFLCLALPTLRTSGHIQQPPLAPHVRNHSAGFTL
ncbi:hypothetical protein EJ06DRAFT_525481 [Trichodelitschia bisporula]|uniref:Uncharacterized protein n=1 Tax=Trichodelitschia bisporula TaxID=703511 RepID=A0A6G1I9C6_9PEZI|nr:hypothetical protein EJ06DRAFT_525481 [Trichodelitschia bisporula]